MEVDTFIGLTVEAKLIHLTLLNPVNIAELLTIKIHLTQVANETPTNIPNPTNPIRMYCGVDV